MERSQEHQNRAYRNFSYHIWISGSIWEGPGDADMQTEAFVFNFSPTEVSQTDALKLTLALRSLLSSFPTSPVIGSLSAQPGCAMQFL